MDEMEESLEQVEEQLVQVIDRKIEGLEQEVDDLNNIIRNTKNAWTLIEIKLKKEKLTALAALAKSKMLLAEMEVLMAESALNDIGVNPAKKFKSSPEQADQAEKSNARVEGNQRKIYLSSSSRSAAPSRNTRRKRAVSSTSQTNSKNHMPNNDENDADTSIIKSILSETANLCMNGQTASASLQNSRLNSIWRKAFSDPVITSTKKTSSFTNVKKNTVKPADIISPTPARVLQNSSSASDWKKAFSNSISEWVDKTNLDANESRHTMSKNLVNTISVIQQKQNASSDSDLKNSSNNSNSSLIEQSNLFINELKRSKSQNPVDVALPARVGSLQNSSSDSEWNKSLTGSIIAKLDEIERAGFKSNLSKEKTKIAKNIKINPISTIAASKKTVASNKKDHESPILCAPSVNKRALHPRDPRQSNSMINTQPNRTPMMLALPKLTTNKDDF